MPTAGTLRLLFLHLRNVYNHDRSWKLPLYINAYPKFPLITYLSHHRYHLNSLVFDVPHHNVEYRTKYYDIWHLTVTFQPHLILITGRCRQESLSLHFCDSNSACNVIHNNQISSHCLTKGNRSYKNCVHCSASYNSYSRTGIWQNLRNYWITHKTSNKTAKILSGNHGPIMLWT